MIDEKVRKAREPFQNATKDLAAAMGVPFVNTDEKREGNPPIGAIGILFYGNDRVGVVEYFANGGYGTIGSSDKSKTMLACLDFATACFEMKEDFDG